MKQMEQGAKAMKEFVQKFKRVVRESSFEEQVFIEEFKWGIKSTIWQRLMKTELSLQSIKQ